MTDQTVQPRLTVGAPAPNLVLLNVQHQSTTLADLWPAGPTLLTFLRHFG